MNQDALSVLTSFKLSDDKPRYVLCMDIKCKISKSPNIKTSPDKPRYVLCTDIKCKISRLPSFKPNPDSRDWLSVWIKNVKYRNQTNFKLSPH